MITCLEFFSGIGGLHHALNVAGVNATVAKAFDMNDVANNVYKHTFGSTPSNKAIDRLTVEDIEKYNANCWLLSPPCQPYTRGGKLQDSEDQRAKPLLHLITLLSKLSILPKYFFLENVKNFECSQSREALVKQLDSLNYEIQECLLSPVQFGIPNHRLRYYLIAFRRDGPSNAEDYIDKAVIHESWPFDGESINFVTPSISTFLDLEEANIEQHLVPEKYLTKSNNFRFDIVKPSDHQTSCFTKAYGSHHIQTSGSMLQTKDLEVDSYDWAHPESLLSLGLRYFTPNEVARLHAFPMPAWKNEFSTTKEPSANTTTQRQYQAPHCSPHLQFPEDIKIIQKHRLLGNSLNCWVVAELYRCLLFIR
ncbi:S-adenosyl-L-methionine-dependent methyltransferase [Umbelopsis sp. PMI_123]|nr:S-adenosyl-L-methionine-dependent methyltransferase [Umbelopsis sp. PMI_123]